jgi:type IV pilus assembly protein PilE
MTTTPTIRRQAGWTLLELVVALAILALLAAIAYPSYKWSVTKGRRADASTALLDLANRMEQYYAANNTFATATIAAGVTATDVLTSNASQQGYYTLWIYQQATNTYTIEARPTGAQAGDTLCNYFRLTSAGVKTVTGTLPSSRCW